MIEKEILLDMRDIIGDLSAALGNGESVVISGGGRSMYPFIDGEKDRIVLEKIGDRKLRAGEIYLYKRADGRYTVHRAYKIGYDSLAMLGDGQVSIEYGVPNGNVLAVVIAVIKPDRTVNCVKSSAVICGAIKMKMRIFVHRCISKLKRISHCK